MMRNVGAQLPGDQMATFVTYLAKNFPEKANPQGAIVPGPAQVTFREWALPTPGSRPHLDPTATPSANDRYLAHCGRPLQS